MIHRRSSGALKRGLVAAGLGVALLANARAQDPTVEFEVVRADTLIGLSNSILVAPGAWREVARLNRLANPNRILPGEHLRIPVRLLRGDAVSATVVSVAGASVQAAGAPAQVGTPLGEGASIETGPDSSAVLALADGSRVHLPPSSLAQLVASRRYGGRSAAQGTAGADAPAADTTSGWFAGTLRVVRGSVEVFATKVLRAKPLEVVTPTAVVGVRGTQYRVGLDTDSGQRTHAEVIEGVVNFAGGLNGANDLPANYGASVETDAVAVVAKLLAPPDLGELPERFERPIVRITPAADPNPLRVQVAADRNFEEIVSDQQFAAGAEIRIAGLDDASWYLRARRVDPNGIEGLDTVRPFVLKARPEPPAYLRPRSDAKQAVGSVDFAWAPNVGASRVHVQVADDPSFGHLVAEQDELDSADLHTDIALPGTYYWRLASIRPSGDHGPYGDPQRFELRPLPEPASVQRSADGSGLVFKWSGRPEDRHQVEFARDQAFQQMVSTDEVGGSEWTLATPSRGGRYYFRYRSIEPDGFISPYSDTLQIDVPRDWSGLGLLLPFLLLL